MKKKRILSFVLLLGLMSVVFGSSKVFAQEHKMESQSIHVQLQEDGSARVQERRVVHLSEGTENFVPIGNLGDSDIVDFKVEEDGQEYEFIPNWDIDWSREQKKFKNGLINTKNGYELVWGIGEYGKHEYVLSYTITNFVKELEDDSQILFWRFVNDATNIPPEKVQVTIEADHEFTPENEKVWAFGFEGQIHVQNGKVEATSSKSLSSRDYVTILTKFPSGTFQTAGRLDKTFEEVKDQAFEGSDYGSERKPSSYKKTLFRRPVFILAGFVFLMNFVSIGKRMHNRPQSKLKRKYKEEYYRDIPYEGPLSDVAYLFSRVTTSSFEQMLTAYILKWIKEDRIRPVQGETGRFFKKETTSLHLENSSGISDEMERKLYQILEDASGSDKVLEEKEFTAWAKKNYSQITRWEKEIKEHSKSQLRQQGYIGPVKKKFLFFPYTGEDLTPKGEELEANIFKFMNYLNDFSLLNEREAVNVKLWDELMIWAAVFGITDKVAKEFEKLYPEYEVESAYRGGVIYHTSRFSSNAAQSVRSSGGGGSTSSSGGGGGSFGGGSGGGTR